MVKQAMPRDDLIALSTKYASISENDAAAIPVDGHGGQRLVLYHLRSARRDGPVVLFGHACGFAAGAYLPLLSRVCAFADVFAYDARGHGASEAHVDHLSLYGPDDYALDLARLARIAADGRPVYFVGHSME